MRRPVPDAGLAVTAIRFEMLWRSTRTCWIGLKMRNALCASPAGPSARDPPWILSDWRSNQKHKSNIACSVDSWTVVRTGLATVDSQFFVYYMTQSSVRSLEKYPTVSQRQSDTVVVHIMVWHVKVKRLTSPGQTRTLHRDSHGNVHRCRRSIDGILIDG